MEGLIKTLGKTIEELILEQGDLAEKIECPKCHHRGLVTKNIGGKSTTLAGGLAGILSASLIAYGWVLALGWPAIVMAAGITMGALTGGTLGLAIGDLASKVFSLHTMDICECPKCGYRFQNKR